jgi:hypothetical protein
MYLPSPIVEPPLSNTIIDYYHGKFPFYRPEPARRPPGTGSDSPKCRDDRVRVERWRVHFRENELNEASGENSGIPRMHLQKIEHKHYKRGEEARLEVSTSIDLYRN